MKKTPPKAKSVRDWKRILKWMVFTLLFFLELLVIADESREMSLEYFLGQGLVAFETILYLLLYAIVAMVGVYIVRWFIWNYPGRFIRGMGVGVFLILIATHVLKWRLNAFSPFQQDLAWLMMSLDLFCVVAIVTCAFLKNRLASIGTFWLAYNIAFLNLVTLANDVNGWEEVRFVVYVIGLIDVALFAILLSELWRKDKKIKKTSISSSKKIKDE